MVIPTFTSGSFERTLLDSECLTTDAKSATTDRRLQHRFLVLRKLGQGTYGKVQLAINKETNQEVAIKTIKKGKIESEEDMLRIRREIHIMKSIRHPYIIHIHEVFETRQKIVIVMQYASGGELYDYLGCHNSLPEGEARRIFRQIASAIYYCHKNKICHRDLKLENILLDDVGNAQIADFGLSNIFDEKRRMNTFCGSPLYASPEIVKGTPYKGPEVDCWSLGVLLYTLIYGTMPFDGRSFKELVTQISEGRYEEPSHKSSASLLIRRLLTPDISKRATIKDVCLDPWVNDGYSISLLSIAEKMAWDANLKTKSLSLSKFALEQNGHEKPIPSPVLIVKKPSITENGTTPETVNSLNGHNGEASRNSDLYEQILNYDVKFIINKLLVAVESSAGTTQNKTNPPALILPVKENGVSPLKPWPQNGENNVASKVESAYVIPIFEVTSVVPKTNKIFRKRNSIENNDKCSKQPTNGIIHKNEGLLLRDAKNDFAIKKDTPNENAEQSSVELTSPEKITDKPQQKTKDQGKNRRNNENLKFASKHVGPFFRSNALTLARIFSAKYERLVRTSIKMPERKRPVPGKLVIPSTFDPTTAACNEATQKKQQILLFPTVTVSENKEKLEKKIDKIKKAALNRNLVLRSNSQNKLKVQKFLLSQAKKMQDFMCEDQRGNNGTMNHINKCDIPPEVYNLFDKTPMNAFGSRQHCKRINFNDFGKNGEFNYPKRKMFRVNYLAIKDECCLSIAKSKSDVQFPTYFTSPDQQCGNLLDVPHYATIQRSASDSEGLQIFRNAFEYIKHCENNKNELEVSYKIPDSVYDQQDKGHFKVSSRLPEEIQNTSRNVTLSNIHMNEERESKAVLRSSSISVCTDLFNTSSNFSTISKQLPSLSALMQRNNKYLTKKETVDPKKFKSFLSTMNVIYGKQKELLRHKMLKRRNSLSCIPDHKFGHHNQNTYNSNRFEEEWNEISLKNHLAILNKQVLSMNHSKNEANFSSSLNLYPNVFDTASNGRYNDTKSIDSLYSRVSSSNDSVEFDYLPSLRRSSQTSQFLQKLLHDSFDNYNVDNDVIQSRARAKSLVESTFSSDDMVQKLSNSHGVGQNNKFLSKFLNELENRENNVIKKDTNQNRSHLRKLSLSGKKPKLEKRSKSFLQLLALKRIHEAEKELDKVERNHTVNAEEESAGSLLEALKTHGYKGVISQLCQESENNSIDYNSSYLSRKRALDFHRYNTTYYDSMPHFTYPSYDMNDLDLTSYEFSPYSNNLDLPSYNPLEYSYNNNFDLTYNFDQTPYNLDQTSYNYELTPHSIDFTLYNTPDFTPYNTSDLTPYNNNVEITTSNNGLDETAYNSLDFSYKQAYKSKSPKQYFPKIQNTPTTERRSKFTLEMPEEASASNTLNKERNSKSDNQVLSQEAPNEQNNNESTKKYSISELPNCYTPRTEKNTLLRTSSTSEDERESVQDRIWRKSFYSRFNNSALSRKERSSTLDSEFSPEVRANGICTPFKSSHRDHTKWQSSKRVQTARKYSISRDSSVASCRSRQRSYDISDENISKMDSDI